MLAAIAVSAFLSLGRNFSGYFCIPWGINCCFRLGVGYTWLSDISKTTIKSH